MISSDDTVFPAAAITLLAARIQTIDPELYVAKRRLRETDPNQAVGVFGLTWAPVEDSYEMIGGPAPRSNFPTLQNHVIGIQAFIKDTDEERGLSTHSVLGKRVRDVIYRDATLRVGLAGLSSTTNGSTETVTRWGARNQRFLSNELGGTWLYLSTLEFWLETRNGA